MGYLTTAYMSTGCDLTDRRVELSTVWQVDGLTGRTLNDEGFQHYTVNHRTHFKANDGTCTD